MKQAIKKAIMVMLILCMIVPYNVSGKEQNNSQKSKEYIVFIKNKASRMKLEEKYKISKSKYTKFSHDKNVCLYELKDEQVIELEKNGDVVCIEENIQVEGNSISVNEGDITSDWNMQMIHANTEESVEPSDKVKIAIIDSGIDFCENIKVKERYNLVPEEEGVSPLYDDMTGHGTGIAGIIAADSEKYGQISGVNSNVDLYSIKVLDSNNSSPLSRVIEAIYKAIDYDVQIINMSFGTTEYSEALHQAITDANNAGILIVAAAGNRGLDGKTVEYPAAFEEVVGVGAVDAMADISKYSSTGEEVNVMAPGELVKTVGAFGTEMVCSGTSIAAPHVVGVASILWQKDLSKSSEFIKGLLIQSSNKIGRGNNAYSLLDLKYGLDIYDEYEKKYDKGMYKIRDNHKDVNTFESIGNVEGSWSRDNHEALVSSTQKDINDVAYTAEQLKLIKVGIRIPDDFYHESAGWHSIGTRTNYIVSGYYVSKVIKTAYCDANNVTMPNGMYSANFDKMKADLVDIATPTKINKIWNDYNITCSRDLKNRRLILWGMIMHIETDAYAHRAWIKINGEWTHIGSSIGTDDVKVEPLRYAAAGQVVRNILSQCINVNEPNLSNYFISKQMALSSTYYNGAFKLRELLFHAMDNRENEPNIGQYQINLGLGTHPVTTTQMGTLMALGCYIH